MDRNPDPMDETQIIEPADRPDTDAALAALVDRKPNRKRTILVHAEIAEHLIKNHAEAEGFMRNLP